MRHPGYQRDEPWKKRREHKFRAGRRNADITNPVEQITGDPGVLGALGVDCARQELRTQKSQRESKAEDAEQRQLPKECRSEIPQRDTRDLRSGSGHSAPDYMRGLILMR